VKITLDEAIQLALQHNHNLLAARTTVQQSQAQEITANLRPNPNLFVDWDYLPAFSPTSANSAYLQSSTEADAGLSYLIERGAKRHARYQAAKDATAVAISTVADNERTLTFHVASQFLTIELAESTLDLAQQDLKSFQNTVDLTEIRYRSGAVSQDDYLKIKIQLLQFQNDVAQAQLSKVQGLSELRNLLGLESVPVNYGIAGQFEYQAVKANLEDLQMRALQARPDLRAAQQGITAATSQYLLAKAEAKQDLTVQANYTHVNGINGASFYTSIPLAIFNRNQGEIARTRFVITQSQESPNTPTSAAPPVCSIFWMPSAAIAQRKWLTARFWRLTSPPSNSFVQRWAQERSLDPPATCAGLSPGNGQARREAFPVSLRR
jgi:cobalt-zinc-cadmium efflux system outer membrane protein